MISKNVVALAKALAPLLAAELRNQERFPIATPDPGRGHSGEGLSPSSDEVIDRHTARQFGLSGRRFLRLARAGAFPCFALDERGRIGVYRRDVCAWLELQKSAPATKPKPLPLPVAETPVPPLPISKSKAEPTSRPRAAPTPELLDDDCDELIVRALEAGKFRVIPGRKKTNEPGRARSPKSRR